MGTTEIREYRSSDKDAVEHIMREALRDTGAYFPDLRDEDGDPALHERYYAADGGSLLVAVGGEQIVGTVGMRTPAGRMSSRHGPFPATVGELKRMHVLPDWQRRGVGRQLLAAISKRARASGYEEFVFSTTSFQTTAHRFYATAGFERFDQEPVELPTTTFELFYYRGPVPGAVDNTPP